MRPLAPLTLALAMFVLLVWAESPAQTANDDATQTFGDPVTVEVLANDEGLEELVAVVLIGHPSYGTLLASGAPRWEFTYTPIPGLEQFERDSFRYQLVLANGRTDNGLVLVARHLQGVEPPPPPESNEEDYCLVAFLVHRETGEISGLMDGCRRSGT